MTTLNETRWHDLSVDSSEDLTGITLEVTTTPDDAGSWVTAEHTTAPPEAAGMAGPEAGKTRYWWRVLIGPDGGDLTLTDPTTELYGRLTVDAETFRPSWTIFAEPARAEDTNCWPVIPCGDSWSNHTAEVQARAELLATNSLRMLTGYQIGGCPVVARPLAWTGRCRHQSYKAYPVYSPAYSWGAADAPMWCPCRPTSLKLRGYAYTVDEVKIDGAVLDPSGYMLLDGVLYRTDDQPWPTTQDLSLPTTEVGTWSVTYSPTRPVDVEAQYAAGVLACEFAKAVTGKSCNLPPGTVSVARAGVSYTLSPGAFPDGHTGIRAVDLFIDRWNPNHLTMAPLVWSPERAGR